jgi:hypothetical protein
MAIFSSLTSLFSGQSSSSSVSTDEPTLAQAAHNRSKSKGKMALSRQDSDVYTSASQAHIALVPCEVGRRLTAAALAPLAEARPYSQPLADDFSSRVSLQVNGGGGPGGLVSGDISRPGSPAAPGSAFLGSVRLLATLSPY